MKAVLEVILPRVVLTVVTSVAVPITLKVGTQLEDPPIPVGTPVKPPWVLVSEGKSVPVAGGVKTMVKVSGGG